MKPIIDRIVAFLLVFCLLSVPCMSGMAMADGEVSAFWEDKISEALWAALDEVEDSDKLPISLWYCDEVISCASTENNTPEISR